MGQIQALDPVRDDRQFRAFGRIVYGNFGLAEKNWILFAVLFVILFVILDVFYSFSDVSYWGMVPALSEDSDERGVYTALGNFTGSIGWNGLTIIVVPIVTWFTFAATGKHTEGPQGWVAFSVIIAALTVICMAITAFGTQEKITSSDVPLKKKRRP